MCAWVCKAGSILNLVSTKPILFRKSILNDDAVMKLFIYVTWLNFDFVNVQVWALKTFVMKAVLWLKTQQSKYASPVAVIRKSIAGLNIEC